LFAHDSIQSSTKPPSDNAFFYRQKTLTNGLKWCFLSPVRDENHVCNEDVEARAGHWLHGQLAARLPSFGHRGIEILTGREVFQKLAIARQSRVFFFNTKTNER
jgi:hypothetical protein